MWQSLMCTVHIAHFIFIMMVLFVSLPFSLLFRLLLLLGQQHTHIYTYECTLLCMRCDDKFHSFRLSSLFRCGLLFELNEVWLTKLTFCVLFTQFPIQKIGHALPTLWIWTLSVIYTCRNDRETSNVPFHPKWNIWLYTVRWSTYDLCSFHILVAIKIGCQMENYYVLKQHTTIQWEWLKRRKGG